MDREYSIKLKSGDTHKVIAGSVGQAYRKFCQGNTEMRGSDILKIIKVDDKVEVIKDVL